MWEMLLHRREYVQEVCTRGYEWLYADWEGEFSSYLVPVERKMYKKSFKKLIIEDYMKLINDFLQVVDKDGEVLFSNEYGLCEPDVRYKLPPCDIQKSDTKDTHNISYPYEKRTNEYWRKKIRDSLKLETENFM